jgi:hypothetical protein
MFRAEAVISTSWLWTNGAKKAAAAVVQQQGGAHQS